MYEPLALPPWVIAWTPPKLSLSRTFLTFVAGSSKSSRISRSEPGLIVVMVPSK
jgi:hypothetical protein